MRFPQDVPPLSDGTVTLRAPHERDLPAVLEQCLDEESLRWTTIPSPYRLEDARWFLRDHVPAGWREESELTFAIEVDGRFAGTCAVRVLPEARGDVGYLLHPAFRGRGVMERALRLMLGWAFETGRFQTVTWWAYAGNWVSRRVAWKLGFSCHGPFEQWLVQRGELRDCWGGVLRAQDPRRPRNPWHLAPRILGSQVVLRAHVDSDADRVLQACTDPRTRQWVRLPSPYTAVEAREWIDSRRELMATGQGVHWAVADPGTDELLGVVTLFELDHSSRDGELGYWAHPDARGRGLLTEACRLAVRHAFVAEEDGGLGLERLTAYAGVENTASLHVLEQLGFRRYGVERRGGSNGQGETFDLVCHDLLREEFAAIGVR